LGLYSGPRFFLEAKHLLYLGILSTLYDAMGFHATKVAYFENKKGGFLQKAPLIFKM
jgi:hypothetical protein